MFIEVKELVHISSTTTHTLDSRGFRDKSYKATLINTDLIVNIQDMSAKDDSYCWIHLLSHIDGRRQIRCLNTYDELKQMLMPSKVDG